MSERTQRTDFQATDDPALLASADRGESHLLTYRQLYEVWERQQWATQDLDFTQDRIDWHERIPEEERFQRMYGLSSFFIGEQRVAAELGPMMRAAPDEEMRLFLCTQIADEARHVAFFDRFYRVVGVLGSGSLEERLEETSMHLNSEFGVLFDDMLHGHRGHARPHRAALHHGLQRAPGHAARIRPGLHAGCARRAPPCRVRRALPARHGARKPALRDAIQRTLGEVGLVADGVLRPHWMEGGDDEMTLFGVTVAETRAFATKALERRMKVIGLLAAA